MTKETIEKEVADIDSALGQIANQLLTANPQAQRLYGQRDVYVKMLDNSNGVADIINEDPPSSTSDEVTVQ